MVSASLIRAEVLTGFWVLAERYRFVVASILEALAGHSDSSYFWYQVGSGVGTQDSTEMLGSGVEFTGSGAGSAFF